MDVKEKDFQNNKGRTNTGERTLVWDEVEIEGKYLVVQNNVVSGLNSFWIAGKILNLLPC